MLVYGAVMTTMASRLEDRLKRRFEVEADFARLGHTYRHGPFHRVYDQMVQRPLLTMGLSLVGLYGRGRRNALDIIVRHVTIHFPDLPPSFDGFRLMQLSDFHIDGVDGLAEALSARLNDVSCDLCVFTGDYRFEDRGPCEEVYPRMRRVIKSIQSRYGIYGVLGNHDPSDMALRLHDLGVQMLINDSACISQQGESIYLLGVDDNFDYGTHDLALALAEVPADGFKILLAHAPELYEAASDHGVQLNLSGHTHAGQLRVPVLGALKQNAACPREFIWGKWRYGVTQGFTSCGVGCSTLPIRFNCPPEIVILELRRS